MLKWFVAGGLLRDILWGKAVKDVDCVFSGSEREFLLRFPSARNTGHALNIWIAEGSEYTALDGDADRDLARRDLTVNACLMDERGCLYMHPYFAEDLRERKLRLVSQQVLEDDPLRVFRLARFAAALPECTIGGETLSMVRDFSQKNRDKLAALPKERVRGELMRALESPKPSNFLRILNITGSLLPWFEEFAGADNIPAGPFPWHDNSVLEHTFEVMDKCSGLPLAVWMAICHDLGKMKTKHSDLPHHFGHEKTGSEMAGHLGGRLGMPVKFIRAGKVGTLFHMKGGMYGTLRPGTRRDLLYAVYQAGIFDDFWIVAGADSSIDWKTAAHRELNIMNAIRLPEEWQGLGPLSGKHLRELQCAAISLNSPKEPD